MKTEFTFDASKMAALVAKHPGQNVKISVDTNEKIYRASIVAKPGMSTLLDASLDSPLDGCPYPPGCTP